MRWAPGCPPHSVTVPQLLGHRGREGVPGERRSFATTINPQSQVAALLTEPDLSNGRSFAPGVASVLAGDYVEETAGWPGGAETGRLLLLHLSTALETAPV